MFAALLFAWLAPAAAAPSCASDVEPCGEVIGYLNGCAIPAAVRYRGRRYDFVRVVPDSERHVARPDELLVTPGLLYVSGGNLLRHRPDHEHGPRSS
jgi:hypothetical protein